MSDTPRTDMFCRTVDHTAIVGGKIYQATIETVDASFARQLERELSEARAEIENKQYTITCASEENQQLQEQLAEAQAEIERLKDKNTTSISARMWAIMRHAFIDGAHKGYTHGTEYRLLTQMFAEWCSKNYPNAADDEVKRLTEIERKDKLIEKMRWALEYALTEARSTECERLIEAALSAAGRGER